MAAEFLDRNAAYIPGVGPAPHTHSSFRPGGELPTGRIREPFKLSPKCPVDSHPVPLDISLAKKAVVVVSALTFHSMGLQRAAGRATVPWPRELAR